MSSLAERSARMFVDSKGRMPKDFLELVGWLLEYNQDLAKILDFLMKNYEEHLGLCTRPIIIQGSLAMPVETEATK